MTLYYVGSGGNNGNAGTSWALRRLTIASGFSLLAAGDTLYIGAGTYRENPSTGANGSGGSPITVIGDEGGWNTDGVGGEIRITGSDNDQTATRATGITCANNWWVFRGMHLDTVTTQGFNITGNNNIVEECAWVNMPTGILNNGASATANTYRKVLFYLMNTNGINLTHTAGVDNSGIVIENMITTGMSATGIRLTRFGGVTMRNLTLFGMNVGVQVSVSPTAGQVNNVNNCLILYNAVGTSTPASTDLTEDYNDFFGNATARGGAGAISAGAHSQAYAPLFALPLLSIGVHVPILGMLSPNSALGSIAGTGVASDDLYSLTRAATSSWGATQYQSSAQLLSSAFLQRASFEGGLA